MSSLIIFLGIAQVILGAVILGILLLKRSDNSLNELATRLTVLQSSVESLHKAVKEDASTHRQEMANLMNGASDATLKRMTEIATLQKNQLDTFSTQLRELTKSNEGRLDQLRGTVEKKLHTLQEDNSQKLEKMRLTVDEKLHATLEKRLGESFKLVSDRLEVVHKGLGEMQTLASGVGDLKKVLTNVKTRGTWGEIQLGNLLEQCLTPEQYESNVATKKTTNDRVEFAIKLPGKDGPKDDPVWLPIDAKFPQESYHRLVEAQEAGDLDAVAAAGKELEQRVKLEAKLIRDKYLDPPATTDFGILFLPIESLYAEILRRPGLSDQIQRDFRVLIAGPTTLSALVNSLQMGFRTLAIEKRSSEVWSILGVVKTEFGKFGDILDKTHKKLREAGNTIEDAARKTRTIERKLRTVEALPISDQPPLLDALSSSSQN